jgi:hypothetical protein
MSIITNKYTIEIKNTLKEVSDFFGFNIKNIEIIIAENRAEYEKILGRKTADWEVGNTISNKKTILLLDSSQWKKEAPMHKPDEFPYIIKHELIHVYVSCLSKNKALPIWLDEGLAGAISGQYKNAKVQYFETDFCSKLDTPFNWNQRVNFGAYSIAYLFTRYLLDKYGFEIIKKIIQVSPVYYSYNRFNKAIFNVFNKNLTELEQEFLEIIE